MVWKEIKGYEGRYMVSEYRQNHEPAKNDQNVKRLQNDFQKKNSQVQQAEKRHQSNPSG